MVFCNDDFLQGKITLDKSHNPYFNRWFSAIYNNKEQEICGRSHNPYFNRWFSAITKTDKYGYMYTESQSLF